jgi:hypothetical protein
MAVAGASRAPSLNHLLFGTLLLITAATFPPLAAHRPWHDTFATYFIAIVLESVPYILLGSLIGGLIEVFMPATLLPRLVRTLGVAGIPATALIAPAFPACECGVLAVARGLMRKGLPLPHTVTYLLAGPVLNPTVLFTTWLAFQDWRYPLLRAIGALFVAVVMGYLMLRIDPRKALLPGLLGAHPGGDGHDHAHGDECGHDHCAEPGHRHGHGAAAVTAAAALPTLALRGAVPAALPALPGGAAPQPAKAPAMARLRGTLGHLSAQVIDHFLDMAAFFLMGVFIASAMKTAWGNQGFAAIGNGALLGPIAMMVAAFVLSLCAEADAFIAASFTEFTLPSHMAFLVFGPMFDIKLFLMYRAVFRGWFIAVLAAGIAVLVGIYVAVLEVVL